MEFNRVSTWGPEIARELAFRAREVVASAGESQAWPDALACACDALEAVVGAEALARWMTELDGVDHDAPFGRSRLDALIDSSERSRRGIFFTPPALATSLAGLAPEECSSILDPSAGSGVLLSAALDARPGARAIGVEWHEPLALGAAIAIWSRRVEQGQWPARAMSDRVVVGDGLALEHVPDGGVDFVVGNPPYMGEKGRADVFAAVRQAHPDLAVRMCARTDLLYLFVHRGLDALRPGGRLAYVTSAYWLQATGAAGLREDLLERSELELLVGARGAGLFEDAPGHHSLIVCARRAAVDAQRPRVRMVEERGVDWSQVLGSVARGETGREVAIEGSEPWSPWTSERDERFRARFEREGTRLGSLVVDRQGFVSGADRVGARNRAVLVEAWGDEAKPKGSPIFMAPAGALPGRARALGLVHPTIRGREVESGRVLVRGGSFDEEVLYVDGELEGEALEVVEEWLGPYRPLLERRREVRAGKMPWYRLHWPRDGAQQRGPKLVVARRAPGLEFMLDLSGAAVSSDCTYLVAPDWVEDAGAYLATLMVLLGSAPLGRYLRVVGKRKGELFEMYSEPLRAMVLPLEREGSSVRPVGWLAQGRAWAELVECAERALERARRDGEASARWRAEDLLERLDSE